MADYFQGNPYFAQDPRFELPPEQKRAANWSSLGDALAAMSLGFANGSSSGRSFLGTVGPAAAMGSQAVGAGNERLAAEQQKYATYLQMEQYRKAQEEQIKAKTGIEQQQLDMDKMTSKAIMDDMAKNGGGFSGASGPLMTPPDLQAKGAPVVDYLTKAGLPPVAAAGVAGHLAVEAPGFNTSAVGDGGKSKGLAQWDPSRFADMQRFAQTPEGKGRPITDQSLQLDFLMHELQTGDVNAQRAYAGLKAAKTPEEATTAFMHFERPEGYTPGNPQGGKAYDQRLANARALMPTAAPAPAALPPALPPPAPATGAAVAQVPPGTPNAGAAFGLPPFGAPTSLNLSGPPGMAQGAGGPADSPSGPQMAPQPPAVGTVPPYQIPAGMPNPSQFDIYSLNKTFAPYGAAKRGSAEFNRTEQLNLAKFNFEQQQKAEEQAREARKAQVGEVQNDVIVNPDGSVSPNQTSLAFKKSVSAAQGTDPEGKMLIGDYEDARAANKEYQVGAKTARTTLENAQNLDNLLSGLQTGKLKGMTTDIKAYLKGVGVDPESFNLTDDVGRTQAAQVISKQFAMQLRNPSGGGGMPGSMSNYEDKLLQGMPPGIEQTPEGNKFLIETMRKKAQRDLDLSRIANDFMRSPEARRDPNALYQKIDEHVKDHPLFTEGDIPKVSSAAQPTPGGPPPTPAQATMLPVISSPEEARKRPSGSYFRTPDGSVRQVP